MSEAAPAIEWNVSGISRAAADGRYVQRFVGATLAADTFNQTDQGGSIEPVLATRTTSMQSRFPVNTSPTLVVAGDAFRGAGRVRSLGFAAEGINGEVSAENAGGTRVAPTAVPINNSAGRLTYRAYDGTGMSTVAQIEALARENIGAANRGSRLRFRTIDVATTALKDIIDFETQAGAIADLVGRQTTVRFRPLTSMQLRNPADTATLVEWNATGLGFFGVTPIARPTVTGSRGANAALTSLCTQLANLGLIINSTT